MFDITKHLNTYLIEFLQESNEIEGYETYFDDYVSFLNEKPVHNHHVANSCNAMIYVVGQSFSYSREITTDDILHIHKLQTNNLLPQPGRWRECGVRVGNHIAPEYFLVPHLIANWIMDFNQRDEYGCLVFSPWNLHERFETIHPFVDGNGRVGRLLWAWDMNRRRQEFRRFLDQFDGVDFEQRRQNYYAELSKRNQTSRKHI